MAGFFTGMGLAKVGVGIVGVNFDRLIVVPDRSVKESFMCVGVSPIQVGFGNPGINLDRLTVVLNRQVDPTISMVDGSPIEVRFGLVRD